MIGHVVYVVITVDTAVLVDSLAGVDFMLLEDFFALLEDVFALLEGFTLVDVETETLDLAMLDDGLSLDEDEDFFVLEVDAAFAVVLAAEDDFAGVEELFATVVEDSAAGVAGRAATAPMAARKETLNSMMKTLALKEMLVYRSKRMLCE